MNKETHTRKLIDLDKKILVKLRIKAVRAGYTSAKTYIEYLCGSAVSKNNSADLQ